MLERGDWLAVALFGGIGRAAHGKNKFSKSESERGRGRVTRLVSGVTIPARNG